MAALKEAALDVSQQVLLQAARLRETLPALPTVEVTAPFWAAVPEFVQRGRKTVPAFNTKICGVFTFAEPVTGQQSGRPESPPTLRAVVGQQPTVDPLMFHEDRVMFKTFATLRTFMDP